MIGKHTRVTFARLAPSSRIFKHNVKDGNFKKILNTNIKNGDVPQRLIFPIVRGQLIVLDISSSHALTFW